MVGNFASNEERPLQRKRKLRKVACDTASKSEKVLVKPPPLLALHRQAIVTWGIAASAHLDNRTLRGEGRPSNACCNG